MTIFLDTQSPIMAIRSVVSPRAGWPPHKAAARMKMQQSLANKYDLSLVDKRGPAEQLSGQREMLTPWDHRLLFA